MRYIKIKGNFGKLAHWSFRLCILIAWNNHVTTPTGCPMKKVFFRIKCLRPFSYKTYHFFFDFKLWLNSQLPKLYCVKICRWCFLFKAQKTPFFQAQKCLNFEKFHLIFYLRVIGWKYRIYNFSERVLIHNHPPTNN